MTDLKTQLQAELPELLKQDTDFQQWLEHLIRQTAITPESFERLLQEFIADRPEQKRKNNELLEESKLCCSRQEQGIGALGARWASRPNTVSAPR